MKKNSVRNLLFGFSTFCIVLVLSEVLFLYENRTFELVKIGVNVSEFFFKRNDLDNALLFLNKSSNLYVEKNKEYFPAMDLRQSANPHFDGLDSDVMKEISKLMNQRLQDIKSDSSPQKISSLYYNIALILYDNGYIEKSRLFLQTSINLTPAVGFLYFELSNTYFNDGDKDDGIKTLESCKKIDQIKNACHEFLIDRQDNNTKIVIGEYKEITEKYLLGQEGVRL